VVVVAAEVLGVVGADVPAFAVLPVLGELVLVVDLELDGAALGWLADLVAVLAVVPPACAARPAKTPVPVSAPASDQRVSFLIRFRPASRSSRFLGLTARLFMTTMVARGPKSRLKSR
jgi:hypothetical protein